MRKLLLTGCFFAAALLMMGQGGVQPADANTLKVESLKKQAADLEAEMTKLRTEIIKADPDLQKIHNQIIALHRDLALRVDSKREMRMLILKAEEVTRQLQDLEPKK
jgi:predicted  nucleic acid-binding Zn-ribbon protein